MSKRIIVQSSFARDGLVVKVAEHASEADIKAAILAALPPEHAAPDLEVFDEAAIRALKKWKFKPLIIDGEPTSQRLALRMRFAMTE